MDDDALKRRAAQVALRWVTRTARLGVGTGSTVSHFIDVLAAYGERPPSAVASSESTARALRDAGIEVVGLAQLEALDVYIDGADEIDPQLRLIKGGGGALTREKICAQAAETFVCIAHEDKLVDRLGSFPLPVEVIPMARGLVTARLAELGLQVCVREGFVTDNGNLILDATGLDSDDLGGLEREIDAYPGVVSSGVFARRRADVALVAGEGGVSELRAAGSELSEDTGDH
jgi:ribose 5-phosphate isomerase A